MNDIDTNVITKHPVHSIMGPYNKPYFGTLALVRVGHGVLATASPEHYRRSPTQQSDGMEQAYDYLVQQRNTWMRNGHPEFFESTYTIEPYTR